MREVFHKLRPGLGTPVKKVREMKSFIQTAAPLRRLTVLLLGST